MSKIRHPGGNTDTTGLFDWLAKQIGRIPVVGGPVEDFLRAPAPVRRDIALLLAVVLIYPAYIFLGMILAIQFIPDGPRRWIQSQADTSFEINGKIEKQVKATMDAERGFINTSNGVIDGSSLFQFDITRDNKTADHVVRYIVRMSMNQPVSFQTYERADNYPFPKDTRQPNCQKQDIDDIISNRHVGDLIISGIGFGYSKVIPIQPSDRLTDIPGLTPAEWKAIKNDMVPQNGQYPMTADFTVQFSPDQALRNPLSCTRYGIYIVMIYKKLDIR